MRMARMATGAMQTVKNAFRCEMHNKSAEMQKTFVSDVFPGGAPVALFHAPLRRSVCLRGLVRLLTNSSSSSSRTEARSRSFR